MRMAMAAVLGATLVSAATVRPTDFAKAKSVEKPDGDPIERGTLRLHYVQKPIGYERYEITRDGEALTLSSDFDFTDRGGRVQLAATLRTKADFTPLAFKATGKN